MCIVQQVASQSSTALHILQPYQKERVFVWLPSHVMISHVHNSHSACCCTLLKKQTIDAFALNASFQKRRNGRTSMQRVRPFAAGTKSCRGQYSIIFARPSSSRRRPSSTPLLELPSLKLLQASIFSPTAQRSKY
ncbi:putative parathyroid hormone 2 receptor [Trichinella spiralis]|uniref:putative parathyroid hormone 2 receptor n=1 Tax=Trichinella spiralis TaxID=6334 RepID=UPI0001EFCE2C|nr:putative parathyroid hormone 2 receptor [Trichinella spiralis]